MYRKTLNVLHLKMGTLGYTINKNNSFWYLKKTGFLRLFSNFHENHIAR